MIETRPRLQAPPAFAGLLLVLALATAGARAEAQGFFLEGEQGPPGDPALTCGATGCTLDRDLDVLSGSVTAEELEVSTRSRLPACPEGYLRDTTVTDIVLCVNGLDEVVQVGDFWVDRYEASIWSSPDCTGTQYGDEDDLGAVAGFPRNGQLTSPLYACSTPGVQPAGRVTWFQAQAACAAAGKHLVTNAEWQQAVEGTDDPGSSGGAGGLCATSWSSPRVTGLGTDCVSYWGVEDMIGNLSEWVSDWLQAGRGWDSGFSDGASADPWPSSYGDGHDQTNNLDGRAYCFGWTNGVPAAPSRGGNADGTGAGAFHVNLLDAPTHFAHYIGFRCAISG